MLNSNQTLLPHMLQNHNMVLNINLQTPKIPNILEAEEESVLKLKCDARALKNPEKMAKFLSLPTEVLQNVVF